MWIIKDIFHEDDARNWSSEQFEMLGEFIDDKLAEILLRYINTEGADVEVQANLLMYCGKTLNSYQTLLDSRLIRARELARNISAYMPNASEIDLDDAISALSWLRENKSGILAEIPARNYKRFNDFVASLPPKTAERFNNNKALFCQMHEKPRSTGFKMLLSHESNWIMTLLALRYVKYCNENNISEGWPRWEFIL